MIKAPGILVNDIKIAPEEINAEVQYHPADDLYTAKYQAMKALVVRELLIQRASELGLCDRDEAIKKPDEVIDALLEQELDVPIADQKTCKRYYEGNKKRFYTSPLFEASHILYLAPPDDEKVRQKAKEKAQETIQQLQEDPDLFAEIAKQDSACSSASQGGHLGQISKGQTMPAFEAALLAMKDGEISTEPVATEVGYHIIKIHKRIEGKQLPFDVAEEWIKDYLQTQSWNRAFDQYIQLLIGRAKISGFKIDGATSPLVQ